jgi:hypothetical protein
MSTRTEYPNFVGNTGKFLKVNATETDVLWDEVDASDITGVLGIDHGGTGADNANDALNNLLPDQTGHVGEVLHTDGTDTYWSADLSAGVQSVTGLDTDNTDPANPIVQIAVDGVTVTGDGTPGNPLTATPGAGADTRVYSISALVTQASTRTTYAGLLGSANNNTVEANVLSPFHENVIVKDIYLYISANSCNEDCTYTVRKNGVDTAANVIVSAGATGFFSISVNESYAANDNFSIKGSISLTATGAVSMGGASAPGNPGMTVIVQVSGGTPLGVQSVSGNGVNNTDPFNPIVRTANTTTEGTLTAADWNTFNGKQDALPTLCLVKAYQSSLGSGGTPFIANTEVFDTTSSYDNTTGIFTAPRTGYYLVTGSFSIESHSADPSIASAQIIKNGSTGIDQDSVRYDGTEGASDFWKRRLKLVSTVQLTSGDTIEFDVAVNTGTIGVTGGVEGNQITITELR